MAKVAADKSKTIQRIPMACADERTAVEFMESMRWGAEPACPRCGDLNVYKMMDRHTGQRNARFLWRCRGCGKQYTVRVGTVMEDSPIPLRHWCFAFWAACSSKKGVSALQIKRQTGLTYKSALYLMHRIRLAMDGAANLGPLDGDVEADETYVGGKLRKISHQEWKTKGTRRKKSGGKDRLKNKTPVMALVSRSGQARARVPTDVKGHNLKRVLAETVAPSARIHTDEAGGYHGLAESYAGHHTVNHTKNEYARQDGDVLATTNTVEAFFSLLKRGVIGTFHNVSRKHLHRYVAEFEFRWNSRTVDDGARLQAAIRGAEGKRLMYRHP